MSGKNKKWAILDKSFMNTVITFLFIEISQVGASLVDGAVISRFLGEDSMAAFGLASPLFSVSGIISGILAIGMQTVCAKEVGRGNFKSVNELSSMSFCVATIISIIMTFLFLIFTKPVVMVLGAREVGSSIFTLTSSYVKGISYGIPGLILVVVLAGSIQLDGDGKLVTIGAISNTVADIILDLLAAKLNMGLLGMGLATSISQCINVIILLLHFLKKDRALHLALPKKESLLRLKEIVEKGSTVGIKRLSKVIMPLVINNYILMVAGTVGMTAFSVKNNLCNFFEIFGASVASAVTLTMGVAFGEKSKDDVRHLGKLIHKCVFIGNGILVLLLLIFNKQIASFYVQEETVLYSYVIFAIYMIAIEIVLKPLLVSRIYYLNVLSKKLDSRILQLGVNLLAIVPSVLIMGELFGIKGALSGYSVGFFILLIIIYIVTGIRNKKYKLSPYDYLRLDDSFDVSPKDVIELDIRSMEDATLVSEQVQMFSNGHKFDKKKSYYSALAIEESIRLIYENNKNPEAISIDLRVVIQDSNLIIRLRDNGNSTYPFAGIDEGNKKDPLENIGITMLRKVAKDIKYYHSLDVNYTIITV